MRSTHSAAACRVSWHSDARLRKPCGRSSTTRNVTGLPRLRSRRANMTESSSIGSSAHACRTVGWGTGKGRMSQGKGGTRGHSADRGGRHDGEVQNEFNGAPWPLAGFSFPLENYHLFSLSLTLPALRSSTKLQKKMAALTPSWWYTSPLRPGHRLPPPGAPAPHPCRPHLVLTTMCTGGRLCSMLSGASSGDMKGFLAMGDEYRGIRVGPWLERLGWKPSGNEALMPRLLFLLFNSSRASASSCAPSGPSKKLTSEGVEGPSVSADSDSSEVFDVSVLPLRFRSCSVRLLRGSVPRGSSGWASAASDTLRRIGSMTEGGSGKISWVGHVGGWQGSSWEGQSPLEEKLS